MIMFFNDFFQFDTISEEDFLKNADTGDILLFRGKNFGSKVTRTFTSSHFGNFKVHFMQLDHVGMILKFDVDKSEIFFLESTSDRGVTITRWSTIRRFIGKFFEHIAYRNLQIERNDEMIENLEMLLKESVGNKYGISSKKLL